jgi:hypothetical protein
MPVFIIIWWLSFVAAGHGCVVSRAVVTACL